MKRIVANILFVCVFILFCIGTSFAEVSVSVLADKEVATMEDVIYISVTVNGLRSTDSIPKVDGGGSFDVSYRGSNSQFRMVNGRVSSSIDFNYLLEPKRAGTFQIPPVTYKYKGKVYKSNPIKITVIGSAKESKEVKDIFVKSAVSNNTPYVNEQIIFTFKLYTRVQIANPTYDSPAFESFFHDELERARSYKETVNGILYTVNEVRYGLFPIRSGGYTIPPVRSTVDVVVGSRRRDRFSLFGGMSEYKTKRYVTEEIKLNVKPLPVNSHKDAPFSNLVGEFDLNTSLGKRALKVNESTTLTITLSGFGNVTDAVLPVKRDFDGFKTFDDKPSESIRTTRDGLYGSKTFKKAFIPLKEGNYPLPSLKFTYFDPKKGEYVVLSTPEYNLDVKPSGEKEDINLVEMVGRTTRKETVQIIGRDVLPIRTSIESLKSDALTVSSAVTALMLLPPGFVYLFLVFHMKRRERHEADESIMRRKRALKVFMRAGGALKEHIKNDSDEFYTALLSQFKIYIGDKFNVTGSAMTTKEVSGMLSGLSLQDDLVKGIKDSLTKLEMAQFASYKISPEEKRALYKLLSMAVKKIDRRPG